MAIRPEDPGPNQGQPPHPLQPPSWAVPSRSAPRPFMPPVPSVGPSGPRQAAAGPPRRTKAESLDLIRRMKGWLIAGSLVAFGLIGLLVKGNVTGVTAAASNASSQSPSAPSAPSQQQQPSSGGFFGQQGGSNFGPSSGSGGFGGGSFGSSSVS